MFSLLMGKIENWYLITRDDIVYRRGIHNRLNQDSLGEAVRAGVRQLEMRGFVVEVVGEEEHVPPQIHVEGPRNPRETFYRGCRRSLPLLYEVSKVT
jgi:hypothetical protein